MAGGLAELTDGALVERHLVGKPEGFEALYRRFWPRLVPFCERHTGDRALAEDVAQEALLRAYSHLAMFDVRRPMWPWLKTIAVHVAVDQSRARPDDVRADAGAHERAGNDDRTLEERELLAAALARVPTRQRVALGLRYVHDWSPTEAAEFLGMNRTAFEQLLFRGRQRLRIEYERATRGAVERWAVLAAPVLAAARRARLAFHRRQAAVTDGLTAFWARLDPASALNAVICTSVACHVAVVTFAGLGAIGVGGAGDPALAGPRSFDAVAAVSASSSAGAASPPAGFPVGPPDAPGGPGSDRSAVPPAPGVAPPLPTASVTPQPPLFTRPTEGNARYRDYVVAPPVSATIDPDGNGDLQRWDLQGGVGWACVIDGPEEHVVWTGLCLVSESVS